MLRDDPPLPPAPRQAIGVALSVVLALSGVACGHHEAASREAAKPAPATAMISEGTNEQVTTLEVIPPGDTTPIPPVDRVAEAYAASPFPQTAEPGPAEAAAAGARDRNPAPPRTPGAHETIGAVSLQPATGGLIEGTASLVDEGDSIRVFVDVHQATRGTYEARLSDRPLACSSVRKAEDSDQNLVAIGAFGVGGAGGGTLETLLSKRSFSRGVRSLEGHSVVIYEWMQPGSPEARGNRRPVACGTIGIQSVPLVG